MERERQVQRSEVKWWGCGKSRKDAGCEAQTDTCSTPTARQQEEREYPKEQSSNFSITTFFFFNQKTVVEDTALAHFMWGGQGWAPFLRDVSTWEPGPAITLDIQVTSFSGRTQVFWPTNSFSLSLSLSLKHSDGRGRCLCHY
jgi:hypothetical protein